MKLRYFFGAFLLAIILNSCVVLSTKKYKSLVAERDSLATRTGILEDTVAKLKADTSRLRALVRDQKQQLNNLQHQINDVEGAYASLNKKYLAANNNVSTLNSNLNSSSSRVNKLSEDLKKREERLSEVEDILRKRDEAANALKTKLQDALLGFKQNGLTVDIRNGKVYVSLSEKLLFPSGSIVIDEHGKQALRQFAIVLNKEQDINIAVEGHTDDQKVINLGQIKDNWDLSVLRATSVCRYLTEVEKVDAHRVTATGTSEFQPVSTDNTAEARARNRRIEIVLTPKLDELYNLIDK
jgi:chemotaxis protein MotB